MDILIPVLAFLAGGSVVFVVMAALQAGKKAEPHLCDECGRELAVTIGPGPWRCAPCEGERLAQKLIAAEQQEGR